jgi:nucleoid-associated protein YgaU
MATNNKVQNDKDGLALIVGGLFVLALVFAAYNYFNKGSDINNGDIGSEEERTSEVMGDNTKDRPEGTLNGRGATSERTDTFALGTGGPVEPQWGATDYEKGDIAGDTYTVKAGDTLWEIAEAAYGNGLEWAKVLEANQDEIGFLPGGQQALIIPGQVLTLP